MCPNLTVPFALSAALTSNSRGGFSLYKSKKIDIEAELVYTGNSLKKQFCTFFQGLKPKTRNKEGETRESNQPYYRKY